MSNESVSAAWEIGTVVAGQYEIKSLLGEGGMGRVYLVRHIDWNTNLAVKCPKAEIFTEQDGKESFENECETWIEMGSHPHIVSCYYVRNLGDIPRVFAEYVEGGNLGEWIQSRRLYDGGAETALSRILDIAVQFAWGLQYAHEKGLVHQDVKPANVMVSLDGIAKVTDFGLAKARVRAGETTFLSGSESILMTAGGLTPAYCSPEQALGQPLSRRTDIWSWGVSVLEMFVGEMTWQSGTLAGGVLDALIASGPADDRIPRMPEPLVAVLRKCFETEPEKRPANMTEIADELIGIIGNYGRGEPEPSEILASAYNNRAISALDLGDSAKAEAMFEKALIVEPHHPESSYNRLLYRWRNGLCTDEEVINGMVEVKSTHPQVWGVDYLTALIHLERGDGMAAFEKLKSVLFHHKASPSEVKAGLVTLKGMVAFRLSAKNGTPAFEQQGEALLGSPLIERTPYLGEFEMPGAAELKRQPIRVWSPDNPFDVNQEAKKPFVRCVAAANDNLTAVSGHGDGTFRYWNLESGFLSVERAFENEVQEIDLSLDGTTCVLVSKTGDIQTWKNGRCNGNWSLSGYPELFDQLFRRIPLRDGEYYRPKARIAVSAEAGVVVSGHGDGTIALWNVVSGEWIASWRPVTSAVCSVSVSKDGKFVGVGAIGHESVLMRSENGEILRKYDCCGIWKQVSSEETFAFIETSEGKGSYFHAVSNGVEKRIARSVAVSMSGDLLVWDDSMLCQAADTGGRMSLWSIRSGRCLTSMLGSGCNCMALVAGNGKVVTSGGSYGIRVWDFDEIRGNIRRAPFVIAKPDLEVGIGSRKLKSTKAELDQLFLESNYEQVRGILQELRSNDGMERHSLVVDGYGRLSEKLPRGEFLGAWTASEFEIGPDSRAWVTRRGMYLQAQFDANVHRGTSERGIEQGWDWLKASELWAPLEGKKQWALDGKDQPGLLVGVSRCGRWGAFYAGRGRIRVFDFDSGQVIRELKTDFAEVGKWAFSPEGDFLVCCWMKDILVWHLPSRTQVRHWNPSGEVIDHGGFKLPVEKTEAVAWSPDSHYLAIAFSHETKGTVTIRVFDLETNRKVQEVEYHASRGGFPGSMVWLPQGNELVVCSRSDVRVLDIEEGKKVKEEPFNDHGRPDAWMENHLSMDGKVLAYCLRQPGNTQSIHLKDRSRNNVVRELSPWLSQKVTTQLGLCPNAQFLVGIWSAGQARCWKLLWDSDHKVGGAVWDEAADVHLEWFLNRQTPCDNKLRRRGCATWTDADVDELMAQFQEMGFGWLHREIVVEKLNKMAGRFRKKRKLFRP